MAPRPLGRTDLLVSPIGFGAFKIGRNQKIKYAEGYDLPSIDEVRTLVHDLQALGINYFDTAPAYGVSEERLGEVLGDSDAIISTKVGEIFENGASRYDFSAAGVRDSVARSCERLRRKQLDLVYVHAHADDVSILQDTPVVSTLQQLQEQGVIRWLGFSGKTSAANELALEWADVLMVEYSSEYHDEHLMDMYAAEARNVGVVVKKALGSGRLPADDAIRFALNHPAVQSVVVGSLRAENMRRNVETARDYLDRAEN